MRDYYKAPGSHSYPLDQDVETREFSIGTLVNKTSGYPFPGEVVDVYNTRRGDTRVVVECVLLPGMQHIFAPSQLEVAIATSHNQLILQFMANTLIGLAQQNTTDAG